LTLPGGGLPGSPGTVSDLAVAEVTPNSATLSFTEVDDGLGQPAQYVVRFAAPPIDWGSAREVAEGTCSKPVVGQGVGTRLTCTVLGLAPSTTYAFQVEAYRSTFDVVVVSGDPSNVAQGTTTCDCWTNKAFMPTPRYSPGVAGINGLLYVVGGTQGWGRVQTALEVYDPASDTWTTRAPMPAGRSGPGVAVVNGILYVVMGQTVDVGGQTVDAYDPATDTWTTRAPMPTPRSNFGVAAVDGIIYAVGGQDVGTSPGLTTLEAYDPATDTWTTKTPMPTARYQLGVAAVNGVLYAVGGRNGGTWVDILEAYDPVTDTWTTKAPMPTALNSVGAAALGGMLYAEERVGGTGRYNPRALRAYDPATDTWTAKAPMPIFDTLEMVQFGVAAVAGRLYAVGGNDLHGYFKAYQP
jgi:N-acetylneuraminic acid mutarotase